jgi:Na+/proline symporter
MVIIGVVGFRRTKTTDDYIIGGRSLGAFIGPLVLIILYWKQVTKMGAVAGIITGGITVLVWKYLPILPELYSLVPGIITGGITVLVSKLSEPESIQVINA